MKTIYIIILLINIIYGQVYNPNNLELTMRMDKDIFLVDEQIYVEFTVKNISNETTYISYDFLRFLKYRVTDLDNNGFPGLGFHFHGNCYPHYLNPGEEIACVWNVIAIGGIKDKKHGPYYYFKAGNYKISAKYFTGEFLWFDFEHKLKNAIKNNDDQEEFDRIQKQEKVVYTKKDTLEAGPLYFKVINPTGIEIDILKTYLNAMTYWIDHSLDTVKKVIPIKILANLIRKYPESKYLETIVHTSLGHGNTDIDMEFVLEKFKNNISTRNLINYDITIVKSLSKNKIENRENRNENMHYLIKKYKDTKIEKYAKMKLLESELKQNRRKCNK